MIILEDVTKTYSSGVPALKGIRPDNRKDLC